MVTLVNLRSRLPQLWRGLDARNQPHDKYHDDLNRALHDQYAEYQRAITELQALTAAGPINYIINGGCTINQRAVATLTTGLLYGSVDRFKVAVTAGTVSAGTITQTTTSTAGRTGNALLVSGASLATTPTLSVDTYIEARDALLLKNGTASVGLVVYHDVGSTISYTISIDKATVSDNFAAVTNIATSAAQPVVTGAPTTISLAGVAMGDCSNGIRIRISVPPGTTTTKNFHYTEWRLVEGPTLAPYRYTKFEDELARCQRYFWKTFPYATAPAQNAGTAGVIVYPCVRAGVNPWRVNVLLPNVMRMTGTVTTYNPSVANANWRDVTRTADSGVPTAAMGGDVQLVIINAQVAADAIGDIMQIHASIDADF